MRELLLFVKLILMKVFVVVVVVVVVVAVTWIPCDGGCPRTVKATHSPVALVLKSCSNAFHNGFQPTYRPAFVRYG